MRFCVVEICEMSATHERVAVPGVAEYSVVTSNLGPQFMFRVRIELQIPSADANAEINTPLIHLCWPVSQFFFLLLCHLLALPLLLHRKLNQELQ